MELCGTDFLPELLFLLELSHVLGTLVSKLRDIYWYYMYKLLTNRDVLNVSHTFSLSLVRRFVSGVRCSVSVCAFASRSVHMCAIVVSFSSSWRHFHMGGIFI